MQILNYIIITSFSTRPGITTIINTKKHHLFPIKIYIYIESIQNFSSNNIHIYGLQKHNVFKLTSQRIVNIFNGKSRMVDNQAIFRTTNIHNRNNFDRVFFAALISR